MIVLGREYWASVGRMIVPVRVLDRLEPVTNCYLFQVEYRDSLKKKRITEITESFIFETVDKAKIFCERQARYFETKADGFEALIELGEEMNQERLEQWTEDFATALDDESAIKLSRE
jgi:hypothetical protein